MKSKLTYTEEQHVAYHEAAHVIAHLSFRIQFISVHLADDSGNIVLPNGKLHEARGTVITLPLEMFKWTGKPNGDDYLTALLAGPVASKIMLPRRSYSWLVNEGTAYRDWLDARTFVQLHLQTSEVLKAHAARVREAEPLIVSDDDADFYIYLTLPNVRSFVRSHWQAITKIGDALLASPTRSLSYKDCQALYGATGSAVEKPARKAA